MTKTKATLILTFLFLGYLGYTTNQALKQINNIKANYNKTIVK